MRYKLHVSRYGGGCVLVCGILGGGHLPWASPFLVLGGVPDGELAGLNASHLQER